VEKAIVSLPVEAAVFFTHPWWWRQYAPLKRRSTIILHGSTFQKTILNNGIPVCSWRILIDVSLENFVITLWTLFWNVCNLFVSKQYLRIQPVPQRELTSPLQTSIY
jgi:uncharacterized membrane protein